MGRRTLAAALAVAVGAVAVVLTVDGNGPAPPAPAPVTLAPPEHPSGRFLPTWLPGSLRVQTEQEWGAGRAAPGPGWTRTYIRRGPFAGDQDVITISLEEGAPALDVDAEVARYAGARPATVQGFPALLLGLVAARHQAALVWSPGPGRLAQVLGSGVSEAELAEVAESFLEPPRLDATTLLEGFTELQRSDARAFPAAVPRHYAVGTLPLRGGARPEGTPSVQIVAAWGGTVPAGATTVAVGDKTGVVTGAATETVVTWLERSGLVVSVAGKNVGLDDVRRIASALREQSIEEVAARPAGAPVRLAHGDIGGSPFELRARSGSSGRCLELVHGPVTSACSADPLQDVVEFRGSIAQGLAFGSVPLAAASVSLELAGDQVVETMPVGKEAGLGTAFYVAAVPPDARLLAVVALGADGQVLDRAAPG